MKSNFDENAYVASKMDEMNKKVAKFKSIGFVDEWIHVGHWYYEMCYVETSMQTFRDKFKFWIEWNMALE